MISLLRFIGGFSLGMGLGIPALPYIFTTERKLP